MLGGEAFLKSQSSKSCFVIFGSATFVFQNACRIDRCSCERVVFFFPRCPKLGMDVSVLILLVIHKCTVAQRGKYTFTHPIV